MNESVAAAGLSVSQNLTLLVTNVEGPAEAFGTRRSYYIVLSLSCFTGIRASLPIFMVALGHNVLDWFPLHLDRHFELSELPTIFGLGALTVLDLVVSCVTTPDDVAAPVMVFVKSGIAMTIAEAMAWNRDFDRTMACITAICFCLPIAYGKLSLDRGGPLGEAFGKSPALQSCLEDLAVVAGVCLTLIYPEGVLFLLIGCFAFSVYWWRVKRRGGKISGYNEEAFSPSTRTRLRYVEARLQELGKPFMEQTEESSQTEMQYTLDDHERRLRYLENICESRDVRASKG